MIAEDLSGRQRCSLRVARKSTHSRPDRSARRGLCGQRILNYHRACAFEELGVAPRAAKSANQFAKGFRPGQATCLARPISESMGGALRSEFGSGTHFLPGLCLARAGFFIGENQYAMPIDEALVLSPADLSPWIERRHPLFATINCADRPAFANSRA